MVIATTLGSGIAGLSVGARPKLVTTLSAGVGRLPRVRLLSSDERSSLLLPPPALGSRFAMPSHMPDPPSLQIDKGARLVVLTPDIRMTNDRRGAFLGLRGRF